MGVDNFGSNRVECSLSGGDPVHVAVETAQGFGVTVGLGPLDSARLAIVVEEIVANLCEHGGCGDGTPGHLALSQQGETIRIAVQDQGPPFDPRESQDADLPNPDRGGGVGLAMVRAWSESLDYCTADGRNLLTVLLRRGA